jgi:putrescine transport system ATP-binding protein
MVSHAETFLRIEGVSKQFDGMRAVVEARVDIARGEIFALLGPSGCGKTTLLRLLAGFETPDAGHIVLDGRDLTGLPPYERPINMMFQSYALFPHLSVWENIAFGLRRAGRDRTQVAERVEAMLRLVQLAPFAQRRPHQLSGGQQQRVALARSLARQPQLLLLDEPLGALDRKLREQTQLELVNIVEQVGVTCVMVTHDQQEAMTMADRVAVMSEGRLMQVGAPADLYEAPASRFVADFIGDVNLLPGTLDEAGAEHCVIGCADMRHRAGRGGADARGIAVTVALRPEKISLSRDPPADIAHNAVPGTVKAKAFFGSFTVYHLALGSGAVLKASAANTESRRDDGIACGDRVWAHWSPSAVVVLTH